MFKGHRGYGLGNVLGGLFRVAAPLLKKGGKALLKEGAKTGLGVLSDVLSGNSLKTAAKNRSRVAGKRLIGQMLGTTNSAESKGTPRKRIKLSQSKKRGHKLLGKKRVNKSRHRDIFSI